MLFFFCPVIELNVLLMFAAIFLKMPLGLRGTVTGAPPVDSRSAADTLMAATLGKVVGTEDSVDVADEV